MSADLDSGARFRRGQGVRLMLAKDALSELDLDSLRGGGEGSGFGDDHDKDSSAGFGRGDGCAIGAGRSKRDS